MTLDDIALAARGRALKNRVREDSALEVEKRGEAGSDRRGSDLWGGWTTKRWTLGDRVALGFLVVNILLIIIAPLLTSYCFTGVWNEILSDLHPLPGHGSH